MDFSGPFHEVKWTEPGSNCSPPSSSIEGIPNSNTRLCGVMLNPLTPNDPYKGRTAPLTSKVAFYVFIQQI